jgi:hypothetical protein
MKPYLITTVRSAIQRHGFNRAKGYATSNPSRPATIQRLTAIRHRRAAAAVPRPSYAATPLPEPINSRSQPPSLRPKHQTPCTSDFEQRTNTYRLTAIRVIPTTTLR